VLVRKKKSGMGRCRVTTDGAVNIGLAHDVEVGATLKASLYHVYHGRRTPARRVKVRAKLWTKTGLLGSEEKRREKRTSIASAMTRHSCSRQVSGNVTLLS